MHLDRAQLLGWRREGGRKVDTHPLVRTCNGKISGPYTHGIQFTEPPKMSMKRKKKATEAVSFSWGFPDVMS